jgi:hypothetical protein
MSHSIPSAREAKRWSRSGLPVTSLVMEGLEMAIRDIDGHGTMI